MNEGVQAARSHADTAKWIGVALIIAAGVVGNWYYRDESVLYRALVLLVLAGAAGSLAAITAQGRAFLGLAKEARSEIRRVVWPTWPETRQTTIVVVVLVIIAAAFLALLDWLLGLGVTSLIG